MAVNKQTDWLGLCFDMVEGYMPAACEDREQVNQFMRISVHAEAVAEYFFSTAAQRADAVKVAELFEKIGDYYDECGVFGNVLHSYFRSLEIREEHLGERHPETAIMCDNIGLFFTKTGKHNEAIV